MSAAVLYSVARACRDGELTACGCSSRPRPADLAADWMWGGCGDDTDHGYKFSVVFVDAREREKNQPRRSPGLGRMLMNLHNYEAGRRVCIHSAERLRWRIEARPTASARPHALDSAAFTPVHRAMLPSVPACCLSNECIGLAVRKVASPLRELTCHMGSHSVTCHPAEVTFPPLPQPKLVLD